MRYSLPGKIANFSVGTKDNSLITLGIVEIKPSTANKNV